MERAPDADEDRAVVEATEWLMLLQDDAEDMALRRRFEAWRTASTANDAAWAELRHLSKVAAVMRPTYAGQWRPFVARRRSARAAHPVRPRATSRPRRLALSALVAVAACVALLAAPPLLLQLQADHVTSTAEQRSIDLPDGSRVTLAPASAIAVSYAATERRVDLLSGEAFFQVRPNADRPFRVTARTVQATVLGTSFDVRLDRSDVTVSVEEGAVRVSREGKAGERLDAGQSVRLSSDGGVARASEAPQLVAAWRRGQLHAQDQRLGDAVDQLRRYFRGTIILTDDALANQRVTGAYNLADPEQALRGIAKAHGATVRRITPWLLVVSSS
jgi:transmembrane sensor